MTTNTRHIVTVEVVGDQNLLRFQREAEQLGSKLRSLNSRMAGSSGFTGAAQSVTRSSRQMQFALQNAGYQVSDFFVQVGSGTSAARALG